MQKKIFGIFGAGGLGRQLLPIARSNLEEQVVSTDSLFFVDDAPSSVELNRQKVITYENFLDLPAKEKFLVIAISDGGVREKISLRIHNDGIIPWSLKAQSSIVTDDVNLGEGSVLSHFSLLTCNIKIGKYFQANHYAQVSHDCVIGNFVTLAPGARCNGNVHVSDYVYVGSNAVIKQGNTNKPLFIGKGAVIGMGAVVTKSVEPGVTVLGNPARQMRKPLK
jgi:sugar O-acyltransferase (sialic acid O-acetyltransferase NeuD family)